MCEHDVEATGEVDTRTFIMGALLDLLRGFSAVWLAEERGGLCEVEGAG